MDRAEQQRLREIMTGLAAGDGAMVPALVDEFGARLRRVVTAVVFGFGRRDVLCAEHATDELVLTAALVICERAKGWDPDGAPPWTWAEKAIRSEIGRQIGHAQHDGRDPALLEQPELPFAGAPLAGDAEAVLTRLAAIDGRTRLWWSAVSRLTNDRNRRVYFEYEIQRALGDSSPARTVAAQTGLSPANVRQIASRVRRRVRALIASDDQFAGLRDLDWFAA